MNDQELDAHVKQIMEIVHQKPSEPCPTCSCCDIATDYGPKNPGGHCCGAYVAQGRCHAVIDAEYGSVPATLDEWRERARAVESATIRG